MAELTACFDGSDIQDHPGKGEKLTFSLSGNIGCNNLFTWLYIALSGANVEGIFLCLAFHAWKMRTRLFLLPLQLTELKITD
ncbi:hypothetical protein SLA2020_248600 [Shorea laevis]